jgi:glucose/arabinose dehydrogenase
MPSFGYFTDDELNGLVAFLNTHDAPPQQQASADSLKVLQNPIVEGIPMSDIVANIQLVTQIPASSKEGPITRVTKLDFEPASGRLFMLDLRGILYELRNNQPKLFLDMAKEKPKFINEPGLATGFGSFTFHPEYSKNGLLYTSHTEAPTDGKSDFPYADSIPATVQWVIEEWKTDNPGAFPFSGKSRELFRINMVTGIHGVQELTFNRNATPGDEDYGLLYIGVGDGGATEQGYPFLSHSIEEPWGTIFRIDPSGKNSANSHYGIPPGNPFAKRSNSQSLGEIYAYGFRNPHRITWTKAGQMLASNIGQANIESVNLIMPGHDYGWPIREGTFLNNPYGNIGKVYPLPADDSMYNITYPVAQYDHGEGAAIIGGFEYTGPLPELTGKYLFADMNNGRLFFIVLSDVKVGKQTEIKEWKVSFHGKTTSFAELCGNKHVDLRFGRDQNGDIYLFSKQDGKVYKLAGSKTIS